MRCCLSKQSGACGTRRLAAVAVPGVLLCLALPQQAVASPSFDIRPAERVLQRLLPRYASQFDLRAIERGDSGEMARISGSHGRIRVEGNTPSALLFGVNWYLKYVARVQISTNGDQLGAAGELPVPVTTIELKTPYAYRYALNENVDGYATAYWDWGRWAREIDVLALSGINAMIVERGADLVLYRTFREVGYSDREIREWITQPAHQNWQLMGNLCCFNGPISFELLQKRAASAQRIIARLRELGITPVLPGFYGIVPSDFHRRFPDAHIVPQGDGLVSLGRTGWIRATRCLHNWPAPFIGSNTSSLATAASMTWKCSRRAETPATSLYRKLPAPCRLPCGRHTRPQAG
jgi:alpha-N-acetylglucosaminidase